mgnify:CR=1 FL=1
MNNENGVTKEFLAEKRFRGLQERIEWFQKTIDTLGPEQEVLRKRYEELLKQCNAALEEELKGRGL